MIGRLAIAGLALLVASAAPAQLVDDQDARSAVAEGDAAFARRAAGFRQSGHADAGAVAEAVAAYERALAAAPHELAVRFKLLEALYFLGHFVETDERRQKEIFTRMTDLAEDACDRVAAAAAPGERLDKRPLDEQARRLASVPGAAEAHFWAAIAHGLWGMSHSKAAAGFHGTAGRIRDHAALVSRLDETFADGGGFRLLGRLHAATPRVPMFTGWIDRSEGIRLLERAIAVSAADPRNPLFLAEALLENAPARRDEAIALLREVASREPDPSHEIEQSETLAEARRILDEAERTGAPPPSSESHAP